MQGCNFIHQCVMYAPIDGPFCACVCAGFPEGASQPLTAGLRQPYRGAEPVPEGGLVLRPEGQSPKDRHPGRRAAEQNFFLMHSVIITDTDPCNVLQCAKLLSDTSVIQFYPSKFVLITDILDTFGASASLQSV